MEINPERFELLYPYTNLIADAGLDAATVMCSHDVLTSCMQRHAPMTFELVERRVQRVLEACAKHLDERRLQGRAPGLFRIDLVDPTCPKFETAFVLKVIIDDGVLTICYPDEYFLDPEADADLLAALSDIAPDDTSFEIDMILHEDDAEWHPAYGHGWVYDEDSLHMAN